MLHEKHKREVYILDLLLLFDIKEDPKGNSYSHFQARNFDQISLFQWKNPILPVPVLLKS